ncbi:competence CoiA-like predicted nuclease [Alkalihalobacillus xiaoxiensis]|uniref:Competence CoiA-like predicted nuclease n=1 Tax=Shouchella xiaoxiensis TaxID=766895 RepID=A0ABS2T0X9_9BACI|nr:competence protein CoiA family protein [Shouchella xiaoxiensis]MBM7840369.1 competence CoiA-like predicted nuclease [Shouchella xiaoxiensis]
MKKAMKANKTIVTFLEERGESEWREWRDNEKFYCIDCQAEVLLRLGNKRKWHFAHKKKTVCKGSHNGETEKHQKGKTDLYHFFQKDHIVELESYIPLTKQRPDILIKDKQMLAVEYQCATIETATIFDRNTRYQSAGINAIWILGGNRLKRQSTYLFKLHGFEWHALQTYKNESYLIYYDSEDKLFCTLRHITALQSDLILAHLIERPIAQASFSILHKPEPLNASFHQAYKQYRIKTVVNILLSNRKFQFYLYKQNRRELPLLSGWPIPAQKYIQLSPFIWQSFFLLQFLQHIPLTQSISFNSIRSGLVTVMSKQLHPIKPFCSYQKVINQAAKQYLDLLCTFQIFKRQDNQTYKRVCSIDRISISEDNLIKLWHTTIHF